MILLENAIKYANDVISGEEITTWEVKKQCEIFLNDYYKRQYEDEFEFYFDEDKLKKINDLLKLMNFATGFVEGQQILNSLATFQCFFVANIFGWRYKELNYKFRYNDNTLFISRKQAKTALIGIIYILLMLTEQNYSEFYSICLTRDLAAEIRKAMTQIIDASPLIKKHFNVSKSTIGRITCKLTNSYFEPRVNESGKNNSIRPACIVSDEHGNFQELSNFNAMKSGMKNVKNPIIFRTTTAYEINNSIMELEDLPYIRDVLNGIQINERQFALVYYAEKEHLWDDIGMYQACPLRIEENYKIVRDNRETAKHKPSFLAEYISKDMNNFIQEQKNEAFIDMDFWKKTCVDKIDLKGKEVVIGVDGSISYDLFAVSIMYKDNDKYYLSSKAFLPEGTLQARREKIDYRSMERQGFCEIHKADTVQYHLIEQYIRNIEVKYNCKIKCIVCDPYCMTGTMDSLGEDYDVIKFQQNYNNLTVPTSTFKTLVYDGRLMHEKNNLLDWCVSNASLSEGKSGHVMIDKQSIKKNARRIDMCAASIFALSQFINGKKVVNWDEVREKGGKLVV